MTRVVVSGYFDPLHVGHLEYIQLSRKLGDKLIVILNNDDQALLKKPKIFMPMEERRKILLALQDVDEVYISIDDDESVCKSLQAVAPDIFANGGDRHSGESPETPICNELGIKLVDGLGQKIQTSSKLIKKWEE